MTNVLPISGVEHGRRTVMSAIDENMQKMPRSPWISIPINDQDLSLGYKDITYSQLVNAVKHAVHWLSKTLPSTSEPFQPFAYAGPKDLRYPILAVAAGKMQKVVSEFSVAQKSFANFVAMPESHDTTYGFFGH